LTTSPAGRALVFLDLETTGLLPVPEDHIWEFAAVRREPDGTESTFHCFVRHDLALAEQLPESFRADHDARYDQDLALSLCELVGLCKVVFAGRPHVVGAVPNFDTERLAAVLAMHRLGPLWHYHIRDVETLARGWLHGRAAGAAGGRYGDAARARVALRDVDLDDSDALSRACGVEPPTVGRHTALGDVRWAMALHDSITGRSAPADDLAEASA
jgi:hypothetical protein